MVRGLILALATGASALVAPPARAPATTALSAKSAAMPFLERPSGLGDVDGMQRAGVKALFMRAEVVSNF